MISIDWSMLVVIFVALTNLLLGGMVLFKNPRDSAHVTFAGFSLVLTIFIVSSYLADYPIGLSTQVFFLHLDFLSSVIGANIFLGFSQVFPNKVAYIPKNILNLTYIVTFGFSLAVVFTNLVIDGVGLGQVGIYFVSGPLDYFFILYIAVLLFLSVASLYNQHIAAQGLQKLQINYVLIGTIVSFLIMISLVIVERLLKQVFHSADLTLATVVIPNIVRLSSLFLLASVSYAIVRHRLFGIKLVLSSIILHFASAAFYLAVGYAIVALETKVFGSFLSLSAVILNIFLTLLVAVAFSLYERSVKKLIREFLTRFTYDPEAVYLEYTTNTAGVNDIEQLIETTTGAFDRTLKPVKQGVMFAKDLSDGELWSNWKNFTQTEVSMVESDEFVNQIINKPANKLILRSELPKASTLRQFLRDMSIIALVPITDGGLSGFYLFGEREGHNAYTNEDIELIEKIIAQFRHHLLILT
jgi:hypothetical protein